MLNPIWNHSMKKLTLEGGNSLLDDTTGKSKGDRARALATESDFELPWGSDGKRGNGLLGDRRRAAGPDKSFFRCFSGKTRTKGTKMGEAF